MFQKFLSIGPEMSQKSDLCRLIWWNYKNKNFFKTIWSFLAPFLIVFLCFFILSIFYFQVISSKSSFSKIRELLDRRAKKID